MKRPIRLLVPIIAVAAMAFSASAQALVPALGLNGKLSVYGVLDVKGQGAGFGAAYSTSQKFTGIVQEIAYTHVSDYSMYQYSALTPRVLSSFPINIGLTAGYSDPTSGSDAKKGLMTGVTAVLARSTSLSGLSFDVRVSSMQKGINPIKWFSDPDSLIAGAGVSYKF